MKKFSLIDNASKAYKMASVIISSFGATVASVWMLLPESTQKEVVEKIGLSGLGATVAVTFIAVIAGRVIKQASLEVAGNPVEEVKS